MVFETSKMIKKFDYQPFNLQIKALRNQGLFQTLEKFQVLQTWIFFRSPPRKKTRFIL